MLLVGVYGWRVNAIGWRSVKIKSWVYARGQIYDFETDDVGLGKLEGWRGEERCEMLLDRRRLSDVML
jgi:hypothetical protein